MRFCLTCGLTDGQPHTGWGVLQILEQMAPVPSQHLYVSDVIPKSVVNSNHLIFHFRSIPMEINRRLGRCSLTSHSNHGFEREEARKDRRSPLRRPNAARGRRVSSAALSFGNRTTRL